jgi:hypothetical protein
MDGWLNKWKDKCRGGKLEGGMCEEMEEWGIDE